MPRHNPNSISIGLTMLEASRLLARLRRQFAKTGVLDVGFGTAKKNNRFNPARGRCVVFIVPRKKKETKLPKELVLPKKISTSVIRAGKRQSLQLPTDVIQRSGRIRPTGYQTRPIGTNTGVTSGVVVRWKTNSPGSIDQWGVITVSHFLPATSSSAIDRLVSIEPNSNQTILGEEMVRLPKSGKVDAVLLRVNSADLESFGLTSPDGSSVRTFFDIADDGGKPGRSYPHDQLTVGFTFAAGHYRESISSDGSDQWVWKDVLVAEGVDQDFKSGRSGVVWKRLGQVTAIQVAGDSPKYRVGYGQVFSVVWQKICNAAVAKGIASQNSMKIVCTF
ncbi:MAG: hypothetical protein ABL921_25060 [Pirellula sp.]